MIQFVEVEGSKGQWMESDTMGIGDMLLGGLTNPFTGKPSSQAQQWMTLVYGAIIGTVVSAIFFKNSSWYKKLNGYEVSMKKGGSLTKQDVGDLAYNVGIAEGRQQAFASI